MICISTRGEQATQALGSRLARLLEPGDVLLLIGSLGAGKTTLVKGLAGGLGYSGDVTSPTFTLRHTYPGRLDLVHADLWRLETMSEILDLALEEELEGGAVLVAEWGEAAEPLFGDQALVVRIASGDSADERILTFAPARRWAGRAAELAAVVRADASRGEPE